MIEFEDMAPGMVTRLGVPMANMLNASGDSETDSLSKEDSAEDANS
jgi:hypothetical protein